MSNPYSDFGGKPGYSPIELDGTVTNGLVGHVRVLGILMAVLGAFELMVGMGLIAMAFIVPDFFVQMAKSQPPPGPPNAPDPALIGNIMMYAYGGLGATVLLVGVLRTIAGISVFRFRGRILAVVSLIGGLMTVFTLYCSPFSLAICIYGLIVLFNRSVSIAFQLGVQGYSGDEIVAAFRANSLASSPFPPGSAAWNPPQSGPR